MDNKFGFAIKAVAMFISIFIVSVALGLVIGLATIDWWGDLLFESSFRGPLGLILLPIAFLVPFLCAFTAQLLIWLAVGRVAAKKRKGAPAKEVGLEA